MSETEGYFQQSFSERNSSNSQFGVSLPIVEDVLSVRVAGLYDTNRQANVKNVTNAEKNRNQTKAFPDIHPANAFIGNYLRSELLSQNGHAPQIKKELVDFYLYMAEQTGTLWENVGASASCNHGFASHVAYSLYRDVLGVHALDTQSKTIHLRIADVGLDWCEGRLLTPQGPVTVKWWRQDQNIAYRADVPAGYVLEVDNLCASPLILR